MAALRSEPGSPLPCHPVASGWPGPVYGAGESHERLVRHRRDCRQYFAHVCVSLACETGPRSGYDSRAGRAVVADLLQTRRGAARRMLWRAGYASDVVHIATPGVVSVRCAAESGTGSSVMASALAPFAHTPLLARPDG